MRMDRRAALLNPVKLPTFAELFAARASSLNDGHNSTVKGRLSVNFNRSTTPIPTVGSTWYSFYAVGSSLEICRIYYASTNSITRTYVWSGAPSGDTVYNTQVSGSTLQSVDQILSGQLTVMRFNTYEPDIIDIMLKRCGHFVQKSYGPVSTTSSTSASSSNTRVAKSTITALDGVLLAMFYGTKYNFSVSATKTPTTLITGASGGSISRTVIFEKTYSSTPYLYPTEDGSSIAALRSYSLFRFLEKW